jgi:tetratricopeptide (TPR) repeat protein
MDPVFQSRDEALARSRSDRSLAWCYGLFWAGDYANMLSRLGPQIAAVDTEGRLALAATYRAHLAACCIAMGDFDRGRAALDEAGELITRSPGGFADVLVLGRRFELCYATDAGWEPVLLELDAFLEVAPKHLWAAAPVAGRASLAFARLGQGQRALELIHQVLPAIEQAPRWARNYNGLVNGAATALWLLGRGDHAEILKRNIREKIVAPDFRYPMEDGRLSLARLCALQGRLDEARHWFAEARAVLDEQGARPLRAVCDYDEALALVRNEGRGMRDEAFPAACRAEVEQLLHAALAQFHEIGMTGWIRRAEALLAGGTGP